MRSCAWGAGWMSLSHILISDLIEVQNILIMFVRPLFFQQGICKNIFFYEQVSSGLVLDISPLRGSQHQVQPVCKSCTCDETSVCEMMAALDLKSSDVTTSK